MEALCSFRTLETTDPVTQCHIPRDAKHHQNVHVFAIIACRNWLPQSESYTAAQEWEFIHKKGTNCYITTFGPCSANNKKNDYRVMILQTLKEGQIMYSCYK